METFRKLREQDCYYVDKTPYVERLLAEGTHYLLSRPRRLGKSLFLDTLKELFEGNRALFHGLHIHDGWELVGAPSGGRLDFAGGSFKEPGLLEANVVMEQLAAVERRSEMAVEYLTAPGRFANLLKALHDRNGQPVAVLVDEYDKPILDALDTPDVARANRDYLRGLYGVIKSSDAHVRFTLVTGVSTFTKVKPVLRSEQPHRHHPGSGLLGRHVDGRSITVTRDSVAFGSGYRPIPAFGRDLAGASSTWRAPVSARALSTTSRSTVSRSRLALTRRMAAPRRETRSRSASISRPGSRCSLICSSSAGARRIAARGVRSGAPAPGHRLWATIHDIATLLSRYATHMSRDTR